MTAGGWLYGKRRMTVGGLGGWMYENKNVCGWVGEKRQGRLLVGKSANPCECNKPEMMYLQEGLAEQSLIST